MGLTYANIESLNGGDVKMQRRNYMDADEIRQIKQTMPFIPN